jgi:hypothetical protein
LALSGCSRQQWGFPRVPVRAASPDGRFLAFVRNHPEIDPPNQTLWLQPAGGPAVPLAQVPPDAFTCNLIVWSLDSRRVAFVIQDAIIQVFEAETSSRVFSGFVGKRSWDVPASSVLKDVSLSPDGRRVTFRQCERSWRPADAARQNQRGTRAEVTVANCSAAPITVTFSNVAPENFW